MSLEAFLIAIGAGLLLTPLVIRAAEKWEVFDQPSDNRRVHTRPVPRLGGVAVFIAVVGSLSVVLLTRGGSLSAEAPGHAWFYTGMLIGGAILFLVGLLDDLRGLRPLYKLLAQVVAAGVVFFLGFQVSELGFGSALSYQLGWLALPVTLLWIVGVTNAFNLIDGLDGLATGIALVALGSTAVAASLLGNQEVLLICAALVGALLGFLPFNFNPARIFLGDSGSLFIGFMLAMLSVHGSMKSATAVLVIVPLFALGLPLLDTALAVGRRWLRGVPLFSADAGHIHHRLLAVGLTHRAAVIVMYGFATALALLGILLAFAAPTQVFAISVVGGIVCGGMLLYGLSHLNYHEFREAGTVVISGVVRLRRIISDQIQARDLAEGICACRTLEEVQGQLKAHVEHFSFLDIELCHESSMRLRLAGLDPVQCERAWKLDVPVEARSLANPDPYVLRIWCGTGQTHRPHGAERVARVIAATIEDWMEKSGFDSVQSALRELVRETEVAPGSEETQVARSNA